MREALTRTKNDLVKAAAVLDITVATLKRWLGCDSELRKELGIVLGKKKILDSTPLCSRSVSVKELRDAGGWVYTDESHLDEQAS